MTEISSTLHDMRTPLAVDAANQIDALVKALQFYADPRRHQGPNLSPIPNDPFAKPDAVYIMDVSRDNGAIARAALAAAGAPQS